MTRVRTIAKAVWEYDPLLPVLEAVAREPGRFLMWFAPAAFILAVIAENVL